MINIPLNVIFILFLFIVIPSLTLNVSSIEISDESIDQQVVQCVLNNSTQPGVTPFWLDQDRKVVSDNQFLTVSFAAFPNSMQFFCLANISSSTIEIGLNYTVLVTDSVLDAILNVNSEVSGSQAVDLSGQISVIANGNISVGRTNQLLDATVNLLSFTNTSTLTDETAGELTVAILNTVSSISIRTNNQPSINTTSQENIGNNIANTFSTLVDVINMLPVSIVDPIIQVVPDGSMLLSQIFSSVTDPVDIILGSISIVVPPDLFQSFNGPTRITTLLSNSLDSFPALLAGSESALIAGSVNSISIQGINGNDIISPPIVITSTVSGVSLGRVLACSFYNAISKSWESTGVTTVLGDVDGEVACQTSHLTSFAVLELTLAMPSLTLNVSSIDISDESIDQQVVQCVLNNSTPGITPFWVDQNRTMVSNNQFLTVSFAAFPNSMQFFCIANIFGSTIEIGLNYTVLVTDSVLDAILNISSEVSVSQAVDLSGQISVIAEGNLSVTQTNQLLSASLTILSLLNASTLTTETATEVVSATFNTIELISDMTIDEDTTISMTEQESIGNNLANNLDLIASLITNVSTSVEEPITISTTETSLVSQVFTDVNSNINLPLNIPGSSDQVSIDFPTNLFQNLGPTRVTAITSNALQSFPATVSGQGNATFASPVNSISILGIDENDLIVPPIVITFPQIDVLNREPVCVFWNLETQVWDTTGVTIVLGNNGVVCLTSHLTSFAVLTLTRESTANEVETRALRIVSYILLSLSLIALLISLILFILSGRRFFDVEMNRMYFNYALALTLAISSFIFGVSLGVLNNIWCIISTILVHYFWLSVFTWGLCIAIYISYLMTLGVLNRKNLFWPLFVLAWILPIPIVLITMIIGLVRGNYVRLNENCFLSLGYIWSLIGPIIAIIVINSIGFFIAIVRIIQFSIGKSGNDKKTNFAAIKPPLIAACLLLPILGIPWIVILLDFILGAANVSTTIFEWVFLILIGPSGVVFLLAFTIPNQAVRTTLGGKICGSNTPISLTRTATTKSVSPLRSHAFSHSKKKNNDVELEDKSGKFRDIIYSNKSAAEDDVLPERQIQV